ncbi:MAG: reverse transcriptase family protein, partial [Bacteroidota bacterium]
LEITLFTADKGPGLFRFKNELLNDESFVKTVKAEIREATSGDGTYFAVDDWGLRLEVLCSKIRIISIGRWKKIQNDKRKENKKYIDLLGKCELEMAEGPSNDLIAKYQELKGIVNEIEKEKGKIAMAYSGAKWIEEGEKPSRYFLNLCKIRNMKKQINVVQTEDDDLVTGNNDILAHCRDFFKTIYSSGRIEACDDSISKCQRFLGNIECPKLSQTDRAFCDAPITGSECKSALQGMMNGKAPSVSGFSKEFFLHFWNDLETIVISYLSQTKERGMFFATQRRGVITLIPKHGDQKFLKNKRAICLLDIVYKIVAKVMANRLMTIISKLIVPDQTGSIRGRYIGTNIRMVADVIEYCEIDKLEGILMALDFRNAFNTVEHQFIYDTLGQFNFGPYFIDWIKIMHKDMELAIINNGYTSQWFSPTRGLQQGCPVSSLIFCLVVEIFAVKIRGMTQIRGITISDTGVKLSQYIDNTTLFVKDERVAQAALSVTKYFGLASGFQLNVDRCQFMWLGPLKHSTKYICDRVPSRQVKILGIHFSAFHPCDNVGPAISKTETTLNQWSQRSLSQKGSITVIKALVISQFIYSMAASSINNKNLN